MLSIVECVYMLPQARLILTLTASVGTYNATKWGKKFPAGVGILGVLTTHRGLTLSPSRGRGRGSRGETQHKNS